MYVKSRVEAVENLKKKKNLAGKCRGLLWSGADARATQHGVEFERSESRIELTRQKTAV
jgi:hypothetical protein